MTDTPPRSRTIGRVAFEYSAQAAALKMELVAIGEADATAMVPYSLELVGDPDTGVVAGGVITTLLDQTCGQAVWAALDKLTSIATLDLRIDYMRPAEPGQPIFAHAHCYKLTRSVAFVRAQAYDRDPADPIATAQAAFMLDSNAGRPSGVNLPGGRP